MTSILLYFKTIRSFFSNHKSDLFIISIYLVAITLSWSVKLNGFFLIACIFFGMLHIKDIKTEDFGWEGKLYIAAFSVLFLIHALSLIYIRDLKNGLHTMEKKWVFLLLPISISIITHIKFDRQQLLRWFSYSVCLGTVVALVLALVNNYNYNKEHDLALLSFNHWFYSYKLLAKNIEIHPAYFSCYVSLVIFYLLTGLLTQSPAIKKSKAAIFLFIYLLVYLILLSSRNILATTLILTFVVGVVYVLYTKRLKLLFLGVAVYILVFLAILSNDITRGRILETFDIGKADRQWGNISLRLQEWDATFDIFRKNMFFGVGPGDFKAELVKRYEAKGWTVMAQERFDSHNQFIQTLGSLGLVGFIVLLTIFALSIKRAVDNRDWLFLVFLTSFIMFSLTESTLEVQKGIVFFTFFNSVFFFSKKTPNQTNFIKTSDSFLIFNKI